MMRTGEGANGRRGDAKMRDNGDARLMYSRSQGHGAANVIRVRRASPRHPVPASPRRPFTLFSHHHAFRPEMNRRTATNNADPMIDQTMGKSVEVPTKTFGRSSALASHIPTMAPINPSAIDTRQPPRDPPPKALPIEPHTPAIINRMIKEVILQLPVSTFTLAEEVRPTNLNTKEEGTILRLLMSPKGLTEKRLDT